MGAEDVVVADDGTVYTGTEDGRGVGARPRHPRGPRGRPARRPPARPRAAARRPGPGLRRPPGPRALRARPGRRLGRGRSRREVEGVAVQRLQQRRGGERRHDLRLRLHPGLPASRSGAATSSPTRASGRLVRRDPDGTVTVVVRGLRFANGVALAPDESFVCVAESTGRDVVRLWLTGPRAGEQDVLLPDLPGYPDNIARGSDGLIWVTIGSPKVPLLELLLRLPAPVRRAVRPHPAVAAARPGAHRPRPGVRRHRSRPAAGARRRPGPHRLPHGHRGA